MSKTDTPINKITDYDQTQSTTAGEIGTGSALVPQEE
jgi:hypothetical protein